MKKLLFLIFAVLSQTLSAATSARDSLALVELYNSCNGSGWTTVWDLNTPVSGWSGVSVINGRVTTINLSNYNLSGTLPWQLGQIDSLKSLFLGSDPISGTYPDSLWNLKKMESLNLQGTSLQGSISPKIGEMKNLKYLYMTASKFSGEIPAEIGNCKKLKTIRLNNNQFSGELPSTLGDLPDLEVIYIISNSFSGPFPTFLTGNTKMSSLALEYNQFSGPIPEEIGNMANLIWVYLGANQFSGEIPASIGNLTKATFLQLNGNKLTGQIPAEIGNMSSLLYLRLNSNELEGALPQSVAAMTTLIEIRVDYCNLDELPDLSGLVNMTKLWVDQNNLDFDDLEVQLNCPALTSYSFSSQDSIDTNRKYQVSEGSSLTLSGQAGGTATSYQWYKDGVLIDGQTDSVLVLSDIRPADTGYYHYTATNTLLSGLTLKARAARVMIDDEWVIDGQENWSGIVEVNMDVNITPQGHLTIQPGAEIRFNGNYKIQVDGRISALGSPSDSIAFYSTAIDSGWAGIVFDTLDAAIDSSVFDFCIFSGGRDSTGGVFSIRQTDQVRISHSRFYDNRGYIGGAVFIENSSPKLTETNFAWNFATYGGAIFLSYSQTDITNCSFRGNSCQMFGGAIHFLNSYSTLQNNVFEENRSSWAGNAVGCSYSVIQSHANQFYGNNSAVYGGAYFANMSEIHSVSDVFEWNSATYGGAVQLSENSSMDAVTGKWMNNSAAESGGAIDTYLSGLAIRNSLIAQNEAAFGGAFSFSDADVLLVNNTVADNHAQHSGGAVYQNQTYDSQYINSVFAQNSADSSGANFYYDKKNSAAFLNCLVEDDSAGFGGSEIDLTYTDNVSGSPDFWGDPQKPYGFSNLSPLLNNGTADTTGLGLPAVDFDGDPRVQDGRIDIGAYEGYDVVDGIADDSRVAPEKFMLHQNYPNPFNPSTTIRFDLPETAQVRLTVFDISGRLVTELLNEVRPAGIYSVRWDGRDRSGKQTASGMYYYEIESTGKKLTGKMLLIR